MTTNLKSVPLEQLQAELEDRRRGAASLIRKRDRYLKKAADIDKQLAEMGIGQPRLGRRGTKMRDAVLQVIRPGDKVRATEVWKRIEKQQLWAPTSMATSPQQQVGQTMARLMKEKVLKKIDVGLYTLPTTNGAAPVRKKRPASSKTRSTAKK